MRGVNRFAVLVALVTFAASVHAADYASSPVTIFYTSSLNGNLDGCECISSPKAGLVKRAVFLRDRDTETSVLIDLGDMLDPRGDPILTSQVLEIYSELNYDILVAGDQEFADGVNAFLEYMQGVPLASHNMSVCPDEESCYIVSMQAIVLERGEWRLGFVSITDPQVFYFASEEIKEKVKLQEPMLSAQNLREYLDGIEVDVSILLYHGPTHLLSSDPTIAEGYDVVLSGHDQMLIQGERIGAAAHFSPGAQGNSVGRLAIRKNLLGKLRIANEFILFDYETDPDDPDVRKRIDLYYEEMSERLRSD